MIRHLKILFFGVLVFNTAHAQNLNEDGFENLFNGKDLENWDVLIDDKGTEKDIFTVEDGILHVYAKQGNETLQSFGGIITKKEYSNYIVTLEYKWGEKKFQPRHDFVRDAGIIFHMHGDAVIWPNGVECQIQEGDTGDLWAIGTQVSSTVQNVIRNYSKNGDTLTRGNNEQRFQRFHRAYCWEQPGWNSIKIVVNDDEATFDVNGKRVNKAINMKYWDHEKELWLPLTQGKILLQAEGAEIYYRNIKIKPL
jgi:hypothetical protein